MTRRAAAVALVIAAFGSAAGACGDDGAAENDALSATDGTLDDITSAAIDMEFAAHAMEGDEESTGPVGFRLSGPFSFEEGGTYPVLRLEYTRLAGADEELVVVTSTGEKVFVQRDGRADEVDASDLSGLRLGDGDGGSGLGQLELAEWVENPKTARDGDADVVTGEVDVAAAFADIGALASELGVADAERLRDLDEADRERLRKLVRDSEVTVTTGRDDRMLRSLDLRVDLAAGSEDDRRALGSLLGARIRMTLALDDVNEPVAVAEP
ncbi:MAG TPA: hypothetical protein VF230_04910 [Acidimicrobiales bacterium]